MFGYIKNRTKVQIICVITQSFLPFLLLFVFFYEIATTYLTFWLTATKKGRT